MIVYREGKVAKKSLQKLIFFSFSATFFCNDIIFIIIRVAEGVTEGWRKDGGYTVQSPPITVSSPFRAHLQNPVFGIRKKNHADGFSKPFRWFWKVIGMLL
ncbi:MAG: hypothetical protein LBL07_13155 [Tannerella sp.]|jgi:hypothetical protein|nr:hypothetical protein [Tannerella sp.]